MKIFTNKKIWQKIVLVVLIFLLFQFVTGKPVHAGVDGDVLLKPVVNLFVSLGDAAMSIIQNILMQQGDEAGESLIKIDGNNGFWSGFIITAVFIIGTALAIVAAIPTGGTSIIGWVSFSAGAILTVTISTAIYAVSFDKLSTIVADMWGNTYYLPMYETTPYEIFADKVSLFDVNFFNPKQNEKNTISETKVLDENINGGQWQTRRTRGDLPLTADDYFISILSDNGIKASKDKIETNNDTGEQMIYDGYNAPIKHEGSCPYSNYTNGADNYFEVVTDEEGQKIVIGNSIRTISKGSVFYHFHGENKYVTLQEVTKTYTSNSSIKYKFKAKIVKVYTNGKKSISDANFNANDDITQKISYEIDEIKTTETQELSTANVLQSTISSWYKTLRNIALVALLSILVYIGIRITLASVASDKAKYKQMLGDWVVALCLIFLMHYIMSFSVSIVGKISDALTSINLEDEHTKEIKEKVNVNDDKIGNAIELFLITSKTSKDEEDTSKVTNAYKTLVEDHGDSNNQYKNYFFTDESLSKKAESKDEAKVLVWPANNFMEQARMRLQMLREGGEESFVSYGYALIYVVLIIYTVIFSFIYMKRVIYMAFLTTIAPLVAVTYPIDKMNDGKAQAFDMWLKEYIFNLLIQPLHLLLYIILIGSAMQLAKENIFYVALALGFFIPAEKLLRRFFGFEKAQTPGMFSGAAASALMMTGLNKLMHPKPPKGGLGPGGSHSKEDEENEGTIIPRKNKEVDDSENLIGIGEKDSNQNETSAKGEKDNLQYDKNLTQDQVDELKAEGIGPGDAEYRSALLGYGINPNSTGKLTDLVQNKQSENAMKRLSEKDVNNINKRIPKRKRSKIRGIARGARNYKAGLQKRYKANKAANGGIMKRGIRMAGGIATAGTLAIAGGLAGITSGDPSKAAQYMAAGAAGGYALGKSAVNNVSDKLKVDGTIEEAKKGYYGDDYKKIQEKKEKERFMKNEENLRKIEDKLKVERKEAKKIMEEDMEYYIDQGGYSIDDLIALYGLEKDTGLSKKQVDSIGQMAINGMNGEDTRYMTEKKKKEYKDTLTPKFIKNGSKNPEADVDKVFDYVNRFHTFKN